MSVETSSNAMSLPIRKSFVLGVLYFIQGLPYGLQDKFIPLMLIMKGHSHSTVALTRLLLLPWLMKPLFAPLIDTIYVSKIYIMIMIGLDWIGYMLITVSKFSSCQCISQLTLTKVKWVTSCLISLSVISLLNATLVPEWDGTNSISTQLIGTLFALNLFSAVQSTKLSCLVTILIHSFGKWTNVRSQIDGDQIGSLNVNGNHDIAVDAIAINILTNGHEVASGNAAQIVGYKLGALFGSGILFWIYSSFGWTGLFLCLFFVYTTVLIIHLVSQRPLSLEGNNHTNINQKSNGLPSKPNLNWTRGLSPEIIQLVLYLLLYKLGESAACTTFPFFLTKSGVTNHEIAFWNGIIAMLCSILGSTIASQLSLSRLRTVIKLRLLPLFVQLLLVALAELAHVEHHLLLYSAPRPTNRHHN
ncbi:Major facilitator super domain-containing protein 3 [Blomia tropicalis]|nr:Major facilitator super domain-containing protein 3 [Blomia tropicalis]